MNRLLASCLDIRSCRIWAAVPLLALAWHGWYTVVYLHPHYLVFVCYPANLMLGIGILIRSGLLTGTGFGWMVIGLPLWLYDAGRTGDWEASGAVFHLAGLVPGLLSLRYHYYPSRTWLFAPGAGALMQGAARLWTDPALNVNAAFGVYAGWGPVFQSVPVYRLTMAIGFGLFFAALVWINRKCAVPAAFPPESGGK